MTDWQTKVSMVQNPRGDSDINIFNGYEIRNKNMNKKLIVIVDYFFLLIYLFVYRFYAPVNIITVMSRQSVTQVDPAHTKRVPTRHIGK